MPAIQETWSRLFQPSHRAKFQTGRGRVPPSLAEGPGRWHFGTPNIPENDPRTWTPAEEASFSGTPRSVRHPRRLVGKKGASSRYFHSTDITILSTTTGKHRRGDCCDHRLVSCSSPRLLIPSSSPHPSKALDCLSTRSGRLASTPRNKSVTVRCTLTAPPSRTGLERL